MGRTSTWFLLFCSFMMISLLACDSSVQINQFFCQDDSKCENDQVCKNGECVKEDKDGDGWSSKKDCDDNNKNIYPGAPEICDNKIDDNCNGTIDEAPPACICLENQERPCGATDEGSCRKGIQRCVNGAWGKCEGEVAPTDEKCNNLDDDCNGKIDDGITGECYSGPSGTKGLGECKGGTQTCSGGQAGKCEGEVLPQKETCDGKDNDCDGVIDNGVVEECYTGDPATKGRGVCKAGKRECVGGKFGECKGEVAPGKEDCNGKDDDCNGKVDDGLSQESCYTADPATKGVGQCRAGVRSCDGGSWTKCTGEIVPAAKETCDDKIDNNCNGTADEGCNTTTFFTITKSINTDNGKIDGVLSPKWGNGQFQLDNLRIPANTRVQVTGSKPLLLVVKGPVEIIGTLDLAGKDGGSSNCQNNNPGAAGDAGGGGGSSGGGGGLCNITGSQQPGGDGGGTSGGKGGKGGGAEGGGGGGAGHVDPGGNGKPTGFGGKGGLTTGSPTTITPGSGGGGGACGVFGSSIFAVYTPAAGGGGGGGATRIESTTGDVLISGSILANGGDGGAAPECKGGLQGGASTGGGGGGGAGGCILIRAKGSITVSNSAFLNAAGGAGGGLPKAQGGDGSNGCIRLQDSDGQVTLPSGRVSPAPTISKY